MQPERLQFLNLHNQPGRLNAEEAAWYLGFQPHDIPVLVANKMLRPLGHPAPNSIKYFLTKHLMQARDDEAWMNKASDVILKSWRKRNQIYLHHATIRAVPTSPPGMPG